MTDKRVEPVRLVSRVGYPAPPADWHRWELFDVMECGGRRYMVTSVDYYGSANLQLIEEPVRVAS